MQERHEWYSTISYSNPNMIQAGPSVEFMALLKLNVISIFDGTVCFWIIIANKLWCRTHNGLKLSSVCCGNGNSSAFCVHYCTMKNALVFPISQYLRPQEKYSFICFSMLIHVYQISYSCIHVY